jgi:glycosyltransferase involved in cell wall biosynthesis
MKISLLHPSRNRAATAGAVIAEWLGKRSGLHPIEYILSIDDNDGQTAEYRRLAEQQGARLVIHPNRNSVQACNQAARAATGDLLIMVSDDFGCPEGWDEALVRAIGERRDIAVLVDDGCGARTMTLPIVDRAFHQRSGYLLFPGYVHLFCDNDLEEMARRLGKLIDAKHLVFPHRHYTVGAAPYDQTYHHAGSSWGRDELLFAQRRVRDFGLRPLTLGDVGKCSWLSLRYHVYWPFLGLQRLSHRVRVRLALVVSTGVLRPKWVRQWQAYPARLRTYLKRRRFARYQRIPEVAARPPAPAVVGREARAMRLAIIVPFRESQHPANLGQGEGRADQLTQFIAHMAGFLGGLDYQIFVVEQSQDGLPFNKGYLMNVGFNLAASDFDYFAFHDVDQLPTNPLNAYAYPETPIHLCVSTDGRPQYRSMVGGVLLINKGDFAACHGWSNRYLGWGQEDDDMANRLRNSVGFRRVAEEVGTYRSIGHARTPGLDETYQFQKNRSYLLQCEHAPNPEDGYRAAKFAVESREEVSAQCIRWVVAIDGPSHLFGFHSYVKSAEVLGDVSLFEHMAVRSQIVALRDCGIDRTRVKMRAGGGELPLQPFPEEQEFAIFQPGALQVRDLGGFDPQRLGGYQQHFLSSAEKGRDLREGGEELVMTFVVERQEYVNLYHTLIELFNAYVAIQLLARAGPFNLLLLDGHCRGPLDSLWSDILKPRRLYRLHDYPREVTRFRNLVLVPGGYASPLYGTGRVEPSRFGDFLSDFVETVLGAYGIKDRPMPDRVLTFVDRRDYKPHPRSDGIVCRKVDDLGMTIDVLRRLYPHHRIDVRGFENLPFGQQLQIARESAVLCGVHGAALAHVLFMRPQSELVEFRPREYRRNEIFENLARLRGVRYQCYLAKTKQVLPTGKLVVEPTTRRA